MWWLLHFSHRHRPLRFLRNWCLIILGFMISSSPPPSHQVTWWLWKLAKCSPQAQWMKSWVQIGAMSSDWRERWTNLTNPIANWSESPGKLNGENPQFPVDTAAFSPTHLLQWTPTQKGGDVYTQNVSYIFQGVLRGALKMSAYILKVFWRPSPQKRHPGDVQRTILHFRWGSKKMQNSHFGMVPPWKV